MIHKTKRLSKGEIEYLLKKGLEKKSKFFIARYQNNEDSSSKYCVIISRKISTKAVERNRLRRQIYESIRINEKEQDNIKARSLALIPKKQIQKSTFDEIRQDLLTLMT